ncbi:MULTISPECIES: hypothetical protein [unclassified Streptomyces]|uniref:hypothetical protein n=1 Tax=unclassified Streptomyces TaxID=2593676 RepID=UPI00331E5D0F
MEGAQQWLQRLGIDRPAGEGMSDVLAIEIWLAHRTQRRFDSHSVIERLTESHTLPMAAEGLRILADAMRLLAQERHGERPASWRWLEHCLNSSAHTALATYTGQSPDQPTRAPARRLPPPHEESLRFKLAPAGEGARIDWQPTYAFQQRMAAAQAWREPDTLRPHRGPAAFTLIIRHRDPEWLWQFARQLMSRSNIRPMVFSDAHTLELRITAEDVELMGRELGAMRDQVSDGRMTLNVPEAEYDLQGGLAGRLEDRLSGMRLGRGDDT